MRTAKVGDLFLLLTPPLGQTEFAWQQAWQAQHGGRRTYPLHVSLQRFVCGDDAWLAAVIADLQEVTAALPPIALVGVDLRPLYSAFRENYILKCRVQRDQPLQALDALVRQRLHAQDVRPHYRQLAVLVTVLEGLPKPASLAPQPLPTLQKLFTGSRLIVTRVIRHELYDVLAEWELYCGCDENRSF